MVESAVDVHGLPVDPDVEPEDRVAPLRLVDLARGLRRVVVQRWDVLALISAGGALGALARWGTSAAWPGGDAHSAWATLQVNVLGAALIGLLMVLVRRGGTEGRYARPFLGVGVLGGYTTFSTYALDVHGLLLAHRPGWAGAYLVGTVVLGLLAAWVGISLGRALVSLGGRRVGVAG
jgi:fluoride exporter